MIWKYSALFLAKMSDLAYNQPIRNCTFEAGKMSSNVLPSNRQRLQRENQKLRADFRARPFTYCRPHATDDDDARDAFTQSPPPGKINTASTQNAITNTKRPLDRARGLVRSNKESSVNENSPIRGPWNMGPSSIVALLRTCATPPRGIRSRVMGFYGIGAVS